MSEKLTSSTTSCKRSSWSVLRSFFVATTSGFRTSIKIGFSIELVQRTQSLRGSNCAHIVLIFSLTWAMISGLFCIIDRASLAVVASIAGSAAEKVYAAADIRWCSTISSEPAQKPPPAHNGPAREPIIISISDGSTFCCSVTPLPVRPKTPKDHVSSRIRRNLYRSLNSICVYLVNH